MQLAPTTSLYRQITAAATLAGRAVHQVTYLPVTLTISRISKGPLSLLYHGTSKEGIQGIARTGRLLPQGPRDNNPHAQELGSGIYLTPHMSMALWYANGEPAPPLIGCEVSLGEIDYEGGFMYGQDSGRTGVAFMDGLPLYCVRDPLRVVPRYLIYLEQPEAKNTTLK